MKKNDIKITRASGEGSKCTVTFSFEFDWSDAEALERFGRIMRELIPEEERAQFVVDFQAAGAKAGFPEEGMSER